MPQRDSTQPLSKPPMPPILARLLTGTFWLALKSPLQVIVAFWSIPLIQGAIGREANGAYVFAWGFGFFQLLFEFGMSSALQRQMTLAWTRGDREEVDRLVACGTTFYMLTALAQGTVLLAIAYLGLPSKFHGESRRLIVGLLWIQSLSAPGFGLIAVVGSVLQAARRYEIIPRFDLLALALRFTILLVGLRTGVNFLAIIATQTFVNISVVLVPALWVMVRELDHVPHFRGARRADYRALLQVGSFIFLMQLSVVLADKVDTTILGYALPDADPGPSITVYQNISKPFVHIRQLGWTLAYLVMPAVAGLAASHDWEGLERLKYDASRLLVGLLWPVTLLAGIYAAPFLVLWVGPRYGRDAPLLQLFLVATLPIVLSVLSQVAIGLGKIKVVALSPLVGSLVNLPLSYFLTTVLGVSGVIWGTVLTTLISNLLVPGVYLFRILDVRPALFLTRTLSPPVVGSVALVAATWICRSFVPPDPVGGISLARSFPIVINLIVGGTAYLVGYALVPVGRRDLVALSRRIGLTTRV